MSAIPMGVKKLAALAACWVCATLGLAAPAAGKVDAAPTRIARVGIMTDTHVMDAPESFRRLKGALGLFKRLGAEMIVNCGDVAERHSPAAYRRYRATVNAVYPEASARPKEVFVYAYHDVFQG